MVAAAIAFCNLTTANLRRAQEVPVHGKEIPESAESTCNTDDTRASHTTTLGNEDEKNETANTQVLKVANGSEVKSPSSPWEFFGAIADRFGCDAGVCGCLGSKAVVEENAPTNEG